MKRKIYTIGHSNRRIEYFLDLLKCYQVELVIDVRTIPGSRKNPQFNESELTKTLEQENIQYLHLKKLGGLRHPKKDSINIYRKTFKTWF